MRSRLGIVVPGLLGGLALLISGVAGLLADERADWHRPAATGGYVLGVIALVLLGLGLVPRAPIWLRLVVAAGLPLLAAMVWQVADEEFHARMAAVRADGWTRTATGVVFVLIGVLAARRFGADERYQPSHR